MQKSLSFVQAVQQSYFLEDAAEKYYTTMRGFEQPFSTNWLHFTNQRKYSY